MKTDPLDLYGRIGPTVPLFSLEKAVVDPVRIDRIQLGFTSTDKQNPLLIVTDREGGQGFAYGNSRHRFLLGILEHLILPPLWKQDLRRIEWLVDEVYRHGRNYKYGGMPFFTCLGLVELAVLDLLGRRAGQPVYQMCGSPRRTEFPVYLSRMSRTTTAEEEIALVADQLATTGARAVKVKIGGRMKLDQDSLPGRTEALLSGLREKLGPDITLYADANGSYSPEKAIRVGRIMEEHHYAWLEEPCPWQDFESTREVADALEIPVAGGEQDSNLSQFAWMIRHRGVDLIQPDLQYCGGFIRACRIARMAESRNLGVVPHSPGTGPRHAPLLHFAAITPNLGPYLEAGFSTDISNGKLPGPTGPGWGFTPEEPTESLLDLRR